MDFTHSRTILYHKQSTSARTLFLLLDGTVCQFGGLPALSEVLEAEDTRLAPQTVALHPGSLITQAEQRLTLPSGSLKADGEFQASVDTPQGIVPMFLARFTQMDPPREAVAVHGGRFIAITEARALPRPELELLRRAYAVIMEG